MIYLLIMVVLSPFTAVIPAVYSTSLLIRKKLKVQINYWNIGLFLLGIYSIFSGIINKSLLSVLASLGLFLYFSFSVFSQNYFVKIHRVNRVIKYIVYLTTIASVVGIIEKIVFIILNKKSLI